MPERCLAVVLIDFENIYYFLKNHPTHKILDCTDAIVEMITKMKKHLLTNYQEHVLSMDAYADFDRIDETPQRDLYLLGVETHNVLGTEHKNAADMRLCIDTLDILYNRSEIVTFVLVAGDRDYIPVIQYLKKRNKTVRVVGFAGATKSVSGDLLTIVGSEYFVDATQFVATLQTPPQTPLTSPSITPSSSTSKIHNEVPLQIHAASPLLPSKPSTSFISPDAEGFMDWGKYEDRALQILMDNYKDFPEVFLTPYLHKLRAELSELTESERKQLIGRLEKHGCFKIEKRPGTPNAFSVLVMNWNSQRVQAAYPG